MSADNSTVRSPTGKGGSKIGKVNGLTLKQRLFCEYYAGEAQGNATEAARLAGYQGNDNALSTLGAKLVRKYRRETSYLQEKITARIEASRISNAEIIGILAQQATASIDDITDASGYVDLKKIKKYRLGHLVKSITPTKFGPRVQLESRTGSLALLAKIRGLEQAPVDNARENRDRAIQKAAETLAAALGITVELALERVQRADAARSGRLLCAPGEGSDAAS